MKIKEYLDTKGISKAEFARTVKVTRSAMTLYCQEKRFPNLNTAIRIVEATNGKIDFKDLMDTNEEL